MYLAGERKRDGHEAGEEQPPILLAHHLPDLEQASAASGKTPLAGNRETSFFRTFKTLRKEKIMTVVAMRLHSVSSLRRELRTF